MGREEPEEWRELKGWRIPRCTVLLLTGRPVSDLGCERGRLDLGAPSPASQRFTAESLTELAQKPAAGVRGRRPTPPSLQPMSSRSRGRASDDVRAVPRCPPLPTGVSGFYPPTSGTPRLSKVWARIALAVAPWTLKRRLLWVVKAFKPLVGSACRMSFVTRRLWQTPRLVSQEREVIFQRVFHICPSGPKIEVFD